MDAGVGQTFGESLGESRVAFLRCFGAMVVLEKDCSSENASFAPMGLFSLFPYPGLAPWAAFFRRFAAAVAFVWAGVRGSEGASRGLVRFEYKEHKVPPLRKLVRFAHELAPVGMTVRDADVLVRQGLFDGFHGIVEAEELFYMGDF